MSHKLLDPRPLVAQSLPTQLWLCGPEKLSGTQRLCVSCRQVRKDHFFPSVISRKKQNKTKHGITNTAVSFLERTQPFLAMYVKEQHNSDLHDNLHNNYTHTDLT